MTPILLSQTRTRDCIIQQGVRYCEDTEMEPRMVLGTLVWIFLVLGLFLWSFKKNLDDDSTWQFLIPISIFVFGPFILMAL